MDMMAANLVICATFLLVLGLALNGLILCYLNQKSQLQKTGLDLVLAETLLVELFWLVNVYNGLVLGLILTDISYPALIVLTSFSEFANNLFGISIICMMSTKIAFLLFASKMLGRSESKVRRDVRILRVILYIVVIFLNNVNPITNDPSYFQLIQSSSQYDCPAILKVGTGNGFVLLSIIGTTIYAEALAFNANGHQAEKSTIRIAALLGLSAVIVALVNYVLTMMGSSETYTDPVVFVGSFYQLMSFGILLPLLIISRTPNLKVFIQNLLKNLFISQPQISVNV